jgi:hypothetical protein
METATTFDVAYATYRRMYDRLANGRQSHEIDVKEFEALDWDLRVSTGWSVRHLVAFRRLQKRAA